MSEISCRITNSFIQYVRNTKPGFLKPLLKDLPHDESYLTNTDNWISWDVERLMEDRLIGLFKDEQIMFKIGKSVLAHKSLGIVNTIVNFLMTPERFIKYTPQIARYFTRDAVHINVLASLRNSATIEIRINGRHTRGACLFNQGMFSVFTKLFGLPAAQVTEQQCIVPAMEFRRLRSLLTRTGNVKQENRPLNESTLCGHNGHIRDNSTCRINGTVFGAESCIFTIKWSNKKKKVIRNKTYKEEVLDDTFRYFERSHEHLVKTNEQLWTLEAKYRCIMENSNDALCFVDTDGIITSINKKGIDLLGHDYTNVIGHQSLDFVGNVYKRAALLRMMKTFQPPSKSFEINIRGTNAKSQKIFIRVSPVSENGMPLGLMIHASDTKNDTYYIESNRMSSENDFVLSTREMEVLSWLKKGKSSWEIAAILNISERTVNFHVRNIIHKLNAVSRTHAVAVAIEKGIDI